MMIDSQGRMKPDRVSKREKKKRKEKVTEKEKKGENEEARSGINAGDCNGGGSRAKQTMECLIVIPA